MSTYLADRALVPVDGMLRRYKELKAQRIAIDVELRNLKEQMLHGICEVCRKPFTRMRPTKKFCSPRCNAKGYLARNEHRRVFHLEQIREALPAIEAAHLMTPRVLNIVRDYCASDEGWTIEGAGERFGLSRQRVSQIMIRAQKLTDMVVLISSANGQHSDSKVPA